MHGSRLDRAHPQDFSVTSVGWDYWFVRELVGGVRGSVSKYVYKVDILEVVNFSRNRSDLNSLLFHDSTHSPNHI
jgi:hypothetical protein